MRTFLILVAVVTLLSAPATAHADQTGGIPYEAALRDAGVAVEGMTSGQHESLIVGNGDLYGIVWQKDGGLYMRVTKNDIWDARVDTSQDGPLPKVDVRNNTISGPTGAPPSYKLPYPHPRCAAALRIGSASVAGRATWTCIRQAGMHAFTSADDRSHATMRVGGTAGASTGYRAVLPTAVQAAALRMTLQGSANASYYVNVYNAAGENILATGWKKSSPTAEPIELAFQPQTIGQIEIYAMTADGRLAENRLEAIRLTGEGETTEIDLPVALRVEGVLDLQRAVATIRQSEPTPTQIRVLADRNVVLIHTPDPVTLEPIAAPTLPDAEVGATDGVDWLHMQMPGDVDYQGMQYALAVAARGDVKAVAVVTSWDVAEGEDVRRAAIDLARRTLAEDIAALVAAHERDWHAFWSRSGVQLAETDMQRWWYRQIYFARTLCGPGAAPPGIMPPLATDATPWHADYHFNYNSWQPFWSVVAANHPELADGWIGYVHGMLPRARWLAKEGFGCDGVYYSISQFLHEPDPAVCRSRNKRQLHMNPWGLTIGMVGMTAQSVWHKHRCQPDRDYLRAEIYPTLRESARFYVSFMEQCRRDADGKAILGPSYSPEHGPAGIANCPFDIAYAHYTFDAFQRASRELDDDHDLAARCRALKELLPDYPVAHNADGQPVVVDWQGCKFKQVGMHNITVPVTPVFPAEQVTWFSPEPVKTLFRRTIADTRFNGNNSHVIFNIAKARLSMLEAVDDAHTWFKSRELPNGLFVWQGHAHGTFMPESIGVVGLIDEFLLQSVGDTIRVFPCWPAERDAEFTRLRSQGGFLVSAERVGGEVRHVTIDATVAGPLRLLSPWKTIAVNGQRSPIAADGTIELQAGAGDRFRFTPASSEVE